MRNIIKTTCLATLLITVPTEAKIKQFLSFGMAFVEGYDTINSWNRFGVNDKPVYDPNRDDTSNIVKDIQAQTAIAISYQLENGFAGNLIYGLNARLIFSPVDYKISKKHLVGTFGAFFGGQVYDSESLSLYLKGGLNYVGFKPLGDYLAVAHRCNPYLELSIRQPRFIHNIELGGLIGKKVGENEDCIYHKPTVAYLKYTFMWKMHSNVDFLWLSVSLRGYYAFEIDFCEVLSRRKKNDEADRKAKEEADRKAKEEADRKAKEEADRRAKEEADRRAKEEAARKAQAEAEADRRAKEEADRRAQAKPEIPRTTTDADRRAQAEAARLAKEEADRKAVLGSLEAEPNSERLANAKQAIERAMSYWRGKELHNNLECKSSSNS